MRKIDRILCFILCIGLFSNIVFAFEPDVQRSEQSIIHEKSTLDNKDNTSDDEDIEEIIEEGIIDSEPKLNLAEQAEIMSLTSGDQNPPPQIRDIIYYDEFDDGELNERIEKTGGNGTLEEKDSSLVLTRTSTSSLGQNASDGANIYLNSDRSGCKALLQGIEFVVSRSALKQFNISFRDENGNDLTGMTFLSTGSVNIQYRDQQDGADLDIKVLDSAPANKELNVNFTFNFATKTISVWINEALVLENKYYKADSDNLCSMNINIEKRNNQSISVHSFKAYEFALSPADTVDTEYELLTFDLFTGEPINSITNNLMLITEGQLGTRIEWTSGMPEILSETGVVNRSTEKDIIVTLTAKIIAESEIREKQFDVTVKQLVIKQKPTPKSGYLIEDSMHSEKLSSLISITSGEIKATENGVALSEGSGFDYFLNHSKTSYSENLAFEFKLTGIGNTTIEFKDDQGGNNVVLKVEDNGLYVLTREAKMAEPQWIVIKEGLLEESEYTVLINPLMNMFSLWYGRDKLVEHSYGTYPTSKIYSFKLTQNSGNTAISDYKVYFPEVPDDDAVYFDYVYTEFDKLTYQNIRAVTDHLRLKTVGKSGSTITWISSNEEVIATDGKVNTPETENVDVTLTAKISKGSKSMEKIFHITVLAQGKYEMPEVKNMIFEEYFDDDKMTSNWVLDETDGRIAVEDEALKIMRLSNTSSETIADLYMDHDRSTYMGVLGLEYTVERSDAKMMYFRIRGSSDFFAANWNANGNLSVYYGEEKDSPVSNRQVTTITENVAKFTILFNTNNSTFSLWINNEIILKNVYARVQGQGIRYARMYMGGSNLMTAKIDNIKFYEAYNLYEDRVELDYDWLTKEKIISQTDRATFYNVISEDLNLLTSGYYGSTISWESSNENIISNTGRVIPVNSLEEDSLVTLTAYIKAGEHEKTKNITLNVIRNINDNMECVRLDAEYVDYPYISLHENGSKEIMRSLHLSESAVYGSSITWNSSNEKYITKSGRVIRPRYDEEDAAVTLTATISKDGNSMTKDFEFIVVADEEFVDPMFMSDEEFFGVWDGEGWTTEGKWNYSYPGMESIGEAAKTGDYGLAKEKLFEYFRNRAPKSTLKSSSRDTSWANMLIDDFYHLQGSDYYQGQMWVSNEWKPHYANVKTGGIIPGATATYSIRSWYNEASSVEIARASSGAPSIRPKMELMVNGTLRTYEAVEDLNIRAGDYKNTNLNSDEYLMIQNFGNFLENDTRQAVIKFNFSDLKEGDRITSAKLVLYSRALPSFSGEKRLIIIKEPTNTWSSEEATWNTFPGYVFSYNGLPGKSDWGNPIGSDVEYWYQMCRFNGWGPIATEYLMTGNETYAYGAIRIMEDYLFDVGDWRMVDRAGAYNPNGIRGGFTRTLDAQIKNEYWMNTMDIFLKSEYATPDFCAAMLKNIWDTANFLTVYQTASGNWRQHEYQGILAASLKIPEFTDSQAGKNWRKLGTEELESMIFYNNLSDGSYIEATGSYNVSAYTRFKEYKSLMLNNGVEVSSEYDEMLHKAAYYNALLYAPDGTNLQYGDSSGTGKTNLSTFKDIYTWYNDKELEYIITYGNSGVRPSWTSRHWPDSTVTAMRANWTTGSPYLFTNVRGGGGHGHADYNGLIVYAYGRILLNDAGIFTYTGSDPYRQWARSSTAHNTVVINDRTQTILSTSDIMANGATGTVYEFATNSAFDYLSQSTPQTSGFDHRRTITFIKPNMWIVSDLMVPDKGNEPNNYKQIWHMLPEAKLSTSEETKTIASNYEKGANIIVTSADGNDVAIKEEMGWYDRSYQQLQEAKYAYFEKEGVIGNATFDTVLIPSNNDKTAAATAEKLPTTANATALKIDFTTYGSKNTGYYYMTYDGNSGPFGQYETDAQVAYVQENGQGKVTSILLKNGTYIKNNNDEYFFKSDKKISEFYIDMSGLDVYITTAEDVELSTTSVKADKDISRVFVNEIPTLYTMANGNITKIGEEGQPINEDQNVPNAGIKMPKDGQEEQQQNGGDLSGNPGNSNRNGGTTGDTPINGDTPGKPVEDFKDTQNHWAKDYITDLREKGIVNGDDEGKFNPNSSITRGEFVAIVVRALGLEQKSYNGQFKDVNKTDWYAGTIEAALENGLISPDETFRPNDFISRQEIAKIIASSANRLNKYNQPDGDYVISYIDSENIENWAINAVEYVSYNGLMLGMEDGSFKPQDNATRAETATVVSRMLQ